MSPYIPALTMLISALSAPAIGYSLRNVPFFKGCPFLQEDEYSRGLSQLNEIIQNQLQTKIEHNQQCMSSFARISNEFQAIELLFSSSVNPSLLQEVQESVLGRRLMKLRIDQLASDRNNSEFDAVKKEIHALETRLNDIEISRIYSREVAKQERNQRILESIFAHLNNALMTMSQLSSGCVYLLGGWRMVLPPILNSMSSLSGMTSSSYGSLMGAGLKLISSLVGVLQDINAKRALSKLITHNNAKILACTYFSLQRVACDYRNALNISNKTETIRHAIEHKYATGDTERYDEFLHLARLRNDFAEVFGDIAAMGSAASLDVELIKRYFVALRSKPNTIIADIGLPPATGDTSAEAEKIRRLWLMRAKNRGIQFISQSPGGRLPLPAQVERALADIDHKKSDIAAVESLLSGTRSFVDLKHELDTRVVLQHKVARYINYFERILRGEVAPKIAKGVVIAALEILRELQSFFAIKYEQYAGTALDVDDQGARDSYTEAINTQGSELFRVMSSGAVAQVTRQTVLSIGGTVQARIQRVFRLLNQAFLLADANNAGNPEHTRFATYKIDRDIVEYVIENYRAFSGAGRTFRLEDFEVAKDAINDGFGDEIKGLIETALEASSDFYPGLQGVTSAHLCALFSDSLSRSGFWNYKYRKWLRACKQKHHFLKLPPLFVKATEQANPRPRIPDRVRIKWSEPCFYPEYIELLQAEMSVYEIVVGRGHAL